MNIVVIGRNEILLNSARRILESGHRILAVVTAKATPEYMASEMDFRRLADSCGAPFLQTQRIGPELLDLVSSLKPDIGVSLNWVSVMREDFTGLFKHGVLNAHFGNLPRFRGNAVTNWALLLNEPEIALTVHFAEPGGLDSGDIVAQTKMPLLPSTTIADINRFAEKEVPELFLKAIDGLASGALRPLPQSKTGLRPFRCHPRLPRDGRIDWGQSAKRIDALIRSLVKPYSGAYTFYRDKDGVPRRLFIWESRIESEATDDLGVPGHIVRNDKESGESWLFTGSGVLALKSVSHSYSGETFAPGRVWSSTRARLGLDIEEEIFNLISAQPSSGRQ